MQQFDGWSMNRRRFAGMAAGAALGFSQISAFAQSATPASSGKLTIYCGRNEELVGPMIPRIAEVTGIDLDVRFGNTAELDAPDLDLTELADLQGTLKLMTEVGLI